VGNGGAHETAVQVRELVFVFVSNEKKISISRKTTTVDIRLRICLYPSVRGRRVWRMKSQMEKRRSGCESQYCKNSCGASVGSQ
jgi:hypothetical protein